MTLNVVMALILRYFTEFLYNVVLKQLSGLLVVVEFISGSKSTFDSL